MPEEINAKNGHEFVYRGVGCIRRPHLLIELKKLLGLSALTMVLDPSKIDPEAPKNQV
jgi:hypothetical protein